MEVCGGLGNLTGRRRAKKRNATRSLGARVAPKAFFPISFSAVPFGGHKRTDEVIKHNYSLTVLRRMQNYGKRLKPKQIDKIEET